VLDGAESALGEGARLSRRHLGAKGESTVNSPGWLILSGAIHATAFALIGSVIYLVVRRASPAGGALAAAASLVIMGLVSLAVMVPVPARWTINLSELARKTPPLARLARNGDQATIPDGIPAAASSGGDFAKRKEPEAAHLDETSSAAAWIEGFLSELRQPAPAGKPSRVGWFNRLVLGLFWASAVFGLARLALGLSSIRRLRARSLPVSDSEIMDTIDILRAELSCSKRVDLRESADLTTPATIGWKHPLVLLPRDWRSWTAMERRAALSHELAHICRRDFLTGVVAQLSLSLHFYNPLAHWLSARLRLEQELAADAWGALLSGGNQLYVTTLAQMALRRDGRAVSWPASAFLPSRATFVRRIEMLRNTTRVRHAPLSALARRLTIGVLVVVGLLLSGVRMPATPAPAQAEEQISGVSGRAAARPYNLAFVPADTKMVLALQPQALLEHTELKRLFEASKQAPALRGLPIAPEDLEQIVIFWDAVSEPPIAHGPKSVDWPVASGGVIRTSKAQDWAAVAKSAYLGPIREARHDGQVFFSFEGPSAAPWGVFAPDDKTVVIAREDLLRELIEDRHIPAPAHSWDEAWNKANKGSVMLALETRWLRRRLTQALRGGVRVGEADSAEAKLETISPLLDKAHAYALAIDTTQGTAVDLVVLATSDANSKPVADTAQALLTLGANAVRGTQRDLRGSDDKRNATDWLFNAAMSLLNGARLETSGRLVHLQAKSSVDLGTGIKLLEPAVVAARAAARRAQSVNNLKQIGLAFHNYHHTNNRFPTAVMYGGQSGKVPYSWRVALLPYLEQSELYKLYNFDEPWDGPNNRKLLELIPAVYDPDGSSATGPNTVYFVFTGDGTALSASANASGGANGSPPRGGVTGNVAGSLGKTPQPVRPKSSGPSLTDITDGTSNTILAIEAHRAIPWTKPEDIPFDPNVAVPELGGYSPGGLNVLFADGSVRSISKNLDPDVFKAMITRAGNEVVRGDRSGIPRLVPANPQVR
jgi:prepilin-type processing-associated H-X9-DG protein